MTISTARLDLVSVTPQLVEIALQSDAALAQALGVVLPESWPPEFYQASSLKFTRDKLAAGPEQAGWLMYYFVLRDRRALIGYGGYKGAPIDGTVEVGYSVVAEHQRFGYATELTRGLIRRAFERPEVTRVIAETMPDRTASIRVLEKLDFRLVGAGSEEGAIRYELARNGAP